MKHFQDTVLREGTGLAVQGATVEVRVKATPAGTGALATLYADNNLAGATKANPLTTEADGSYDCYVEDGSYDLVIEYGNTALTIADVEIFDYDDRLSIAVGDGRYTQRGNNLSDLVDKAAARGNLLLGTAAVENATLFAVTMADRTALAAHTATSTAFLRENGREGLFHHFTAAEYTAATGRTLADDIAADATRQGILVATATGAWVRKIDFAVNPRWWGLTPGDNSANTAGNDAALDAMWATLRALAFNLQSGLRQGLYPVRIPAGFYWCSGLELVDGTVLLEGAGATIVNSYGAFATVIKVPTGAPGIIVQDENTSGTTTKDGVSHISGRGSVVRGFALVGSYAGVENNEHGILMRGRAHIEDMVIEGFGGDAICVLAGVTAATGVSDYAASTDFGGNATGFTVKRVKPRNCRDGLHVVGNNASASYIEQLDGFGCRRWGINDETPINNSYHACQMNFCGGKDSFGSTPSVVHYNDGVNGDHLYAVIVGQEVWCSTNPPSGTATDNQGWHYLKSAAADANRPTWVSGTTYRAGGGFRTSDAQAQHIFTGCYDETWGGKAQLGAATRVDSGSLVQWMRDSGAYLKVNSAGELASNAGFTTSKNVKADGAASRFGPQSGTAANNNVYFDTTSSSNVLNFRAWAAGVPTTNGTISAGATTGIQLDSTHSVKFKKSGTIIAQLDANRFFVSAAKALNLTPGATPTGVTDGDLWYDSTALKFKKRENGVTSDLVPRAAAVADLTVTATAGALPATDGAVTIADANAPTNAELLQYCRELEVKLEEALASFRTSTLMAT